MPVGRLVDMLLHSQRRAHPQGEDIELARLIQEQERVRVRKIVLYGMHSPPEEPCDTVFSLHMCI